jgi:ABC-2 type transport system ATP-binding protein
MDAVIIEGLTKKYNSFTALNNLNLKIKSNMIVGYLGPNGAGKTTTIKILTNLIRATNGKVYIDNVDVAEDPKQALSNVGVVAETPEFYPYLTPRETLSYLGKVRGMDREYIKKRNKEVMEEVKLTEWMDQRIGKFSRGMKQRLAIAQAFLHEPQILIFDEPASGLDPRGLIEVREIIKRQKKENRTIFMSSHLLHEVQEVCDKLALLNFGKLIAYDDVDNLSKLTIIKKIEVKTHSALTPDQITRIKNVTNVENVQRRDANTFVIEFEGDDAVKADLLNDMQELGLKVVSFKSEGTDLENIYMSMIKESR